MVCFMNKGTFTFVAALNDKSGGSRVSVSVVRTDRFGWWAANQVGLQVRANSMGHTVEPYPWTAACKSC